MSDQPSISPFESPPSPEPSTTTAADGRQIAYATYGDPDGTPVVFLHGTPGSRRLGALFHADARERGVRILAPDRPGYGRSSPRPLSGVREAGPLVRALLDDAGVERAGIIAFSGGSPFALAAAATCPERVRRVDSVAGVAPPGSTDDLPIVQRLLSGLATRAPSLLAGLLRGQAVLARRLDPSFVVAQYTTGGDEAVPDAVASVVRDDFLEAFARTRAGVVTEFRLTAAEWGIDFEEVDADVRLWHGDDDTNVPIDGVRRLRDRLPSADLRVLEGADHLGTLLRSVDDVLGVQRSSADDGRAGRF
ncbi:alpha/beta fold hydrolase [Halobellus sp. GM3]|uniref:alpha/beta fold hydrolase n=1 Tax=Halobellus sp. GM3 TaxID=3458410 RepID=UPI00403D7C72